MQLLMLGSKGIDIVNNSDICDTYKDLFLSEKEREKNYFKEYREQKTHLEAKKQMVQHLS